VYINKIIKWSVAIILVTILAILYRTYNPSGNIYFPKCPIRELIGLKCPGCGSQRAVHSLLNFDIFNAITENAILVLSVPYILTGLVFDSLKRTNESILKWRRKLFGKKAIFVILTIIISFWILRNII
tara:strand:+ start:943 stop:1326 length:384 start_codon:yes stop_codon:yes gene_type:complete